MITCAGDTVAIELDQVGRFAPLPPEVAEAVLQADLDGVRAGHVRGRGHERSCGSVRGSRRRRRTAEGGLQSVVSRRGVLLGDGVLRRQRVALVVDREAGLDEELARERAGVLDLARVVLLRRADVGGLAGDRVPAGAEFSWPRNLRMRSR